MKNDAITVMLVDDHPVVRNGYTKLLDNQPDIRVIAEYDNGETACVKYSDVKPDIVILDLNMPGIGGLETIRRLIAKDSKTKILAFTMHDSNIMITRALEAGAAGYLLKSSSAEEMIEAVRQVYTGKRYIDKNVQIDLKIPSSYVSNPVELLTKREFQVFCALAEGRTVAEIASAISISPKTVGVHQTNLMKKLNLKNASELTHLAIQTGIVVA